MRPRILIASLPLLFLLPLCARPASADPAAEQPERALLERRIERMERRIADQGSGLLARSQQSIVQLEDLLQRGEYRQFSGYVEREIVGLWRQVDGRAVTQLGQSPPPELSPGQRTMLRRNALLVRRINTNLRRTRRLLTRVEKMGDESQRRLVEVERAQGRYERLVEELAQIDPAAAAQRRAWIDSHLRPRREVLQDRRRLLTENMQSLLHWSEDPGLHGMLRELGRVNRALEGLQSEFRGSLRG